MRAARRRRPGHPAAQAGPRLAGLPADQLSDEFIAQLLTSVLALRAAGIAHGALSPQTVVVTPDGPCLRDFRRASSSAPAGRTAVCGRGRPTVAARSAGASPGRVTVIEQLDSVCAKVITKGMPNLASISRTRPAGTGAPPLIA